MIMCLYVRALSMEKSEQLLAVACSNEVGYVCVIETWFKPYTSMEYVGLARFCYERKHRLEKGDG